MIRAKLLRLERKRYRLEKAREASIMAQAIEILVDLALVDIKRTLA